MFPKNYEMWTNPVMKIDTSRSVWIEFCEFVK